MQPQHCFEVFQDHAVDVTYVALQDSQLVSVDADGNLWRMNIMSGKIFPVRNAHKDAITCVIFSPDTSVIATASRDATVGLWDVLSDELIYRLSVPDQSEITSISFSPDGTKVVVGTKAGSTVVSCPFLLIPTTGFYCLCTLVRILLQVC